MLITMADGKPSAPGVEGAATLRIDQPDEPPRTAQPRVGDELVGRKLGEFVVRDRIGEGGFGAVYRAFQPLLGREVVLKVLRTQLRRNELAVQRFLREARLASRLDHPYAAHVYAFGVETDGLLWIAMELVDGQPLDRWLAERGRAPLDVVIPLVECLCEVVHTAHERGIIHRDLKPSNVMVLHRAGRLLPKLLDLGIAKAVAMPLALDSTVETTDPNDDNQLTRQGTVLGSPLYMAPEQWTDSAASDERTDVYALGILTFEMLTGRVPFHGRTTLEIMRAHAEDPVPPLGAEFPAALDDVLERAMHKDSDGRYGSPLELASALRLAAGLGGDTLPELPTALREAWVRGAPQPLAEAMAALDAARSVREARVALAALADATLRYLGIVTLACCAASGPLAAGSVVRDHVRELKDRRFTGEDWFALAIGLVRDLDPDRFLWPALARCLRDEAALVPLVAARPTAGLGDPQLRDALVAAIAELAPVLERLRFLLDSDLGIARAGHFELWMGVRRPRRASRALALELAEGTPCIVSPTELPIVLAPLAEVSAPTPGAPEELFLLDGRGSRNAARFVADPAGFECNRDEIWPWLGMRLLDTVESSSEIAPVEDSPYPGLSAFGKGDAQRFFGREREADALLNRLRVQPLVAVVGASGAGKSSFVHAGVIPNLPEGWSPVTVRPGSDPDAALESLLRSLGLAADAAATAAADPEAFGAAVRATGDARGCVVIVVDQFEELFTMCSDPPTQARFGDALAAAARTAAEPVRVIFTMRDDFLVRAEQIRSLRDRLTWGLQVLTTPAHDDLIRILVEPARRAGYTFEDNALPREMVDAVADKPGALALLAFTASMLWAERDRETRRLTRGAYAAMGGVGGALARHAEAVLDAMIHDEKRLVREAFRHLVTADRTRAVVQRRDLVNMLKSDRASVVLEKLVDARLLVASEGPDATDRIEVIHEALLDAWPRLREWVLEDREGARLRDQLRAAAKQWQDRDRQTGLLWRGDVLTEYELWRRKHPSPLGELEEAFALASAREAARGRRFRRAAVAIALVMLSVAVIVLLQLRATAARERGEAQTQRTRAENLAATSHSELVDQLEMQGRTAGIAGDVVHATEHLLHAYDEGLTGRGLAIMLQRIVMSRTALIRKLDLTASVRLAEFSPDGTRVLAVRDGDGQIAVLDVASGHTRVHVPPGESHSAHFDHAGTRVAIAGARPEIWDLARDITVPVAVAPQDNVVFLAFTQDDRYLAAQGDSFVAICDARTGAVLQRLAADESWVAPVVASNRIAAPAGRATIAVWDPDGRRVKTLSGHTDDITQLVFTSDDRLLSASRDGTARLWNLASGAADVVFEHGGPLNGVAISPSADYVLTLGASAAKLWDRRGKLIGELATQRGRLLVGNFDPQHPRVVIAGADGKACEYEVPSGAVLQCLEGHVGSLTSAAFDRAGTTIVTASLDGTTRLWHADLHPFVASFRFEDSADLVAFSHDSKLLAATEYGDVVHVIDVEHAKEQWAGKRDGSSIVAVAFTDDARLVTVDDTDAVVWSRDGKAETVVHPDNGAYTDMKLIAGTMVLATSTGSIELRALARPDMPTVIRAHRGAIQQLAANATGFASASSDGTAALFDPKGQLLATFVGHRGGVTDVAFSDDGQLIATAGRDRTARVWTRSGTPVAVLHSAGGGLRFPRFVRDHQLVAAHEDGSVSVWDVRTGASLAIMKAHVANALALERSPSGDLVISGGKDHEAFVWDLERRGAVLRLDGHVDTVIGVAISPDERYLATASWDHTVKLWQLTAASAPELVRQLRP